MTDDLLAMAQRVLADQPFNGLVGARLTSFGSGVATLEIDIDDRHRQQYGLVHGGVLSYAADNVLTFAAGTVLGTSVVTGGLTINYLKAARHGTLRATGTVAHHTSRQAVCTATIDTVAPDGTVVPCAIASGTVLATAKSEDGARSAPDVVEQTTADIPAYVLVRSDDVEAGPAIATYVRSVDESLEKYGAEILVQGPPARVLEGAWSGFVTLLRFPDRLAAERWYDSPEYGAIRHLRQAASTPTGILVEGVPPGHRSADLAAIFELG